MCCAVLKPSGACIHRDVGGDLSFRDNSIVWLPLKQKTSSSLPGPRLHMWRHRQRSRNSEYHPKWELKLLQREIVSFEPSHSSATTVVKISGDYWWPPWQGATVVNKIMETEVHCEVFIRPKLTTAQYRIDFQITCLCYGDNIYD
jgi:hypothetical protein